MKTRKVALLAATATLFGLTSCQDGRDEPMLTSADDTTMSSVTITTTVGADSTTAEESGTTGPKLDSLVDTTGGPGDCVGDGNCTMIDLVFVIDNSGTMGEEQLNLAANFPLLVNQLRNLTDAAGNMLYPSVNIMVTTTDFGHPLCTPFEKPDYEPRRGAPVYQGCNARINRFTGLGNHNPFVIEEACTASCPMDIAPADQFLHFDALGTNVPTDDPAKALSCIGPQGIDGCGYEAPLETMLQAINPTACWNNPNTDECNASEEWGQFSKPFLRDGAVLAIAIVTDEVDCSVAAPEGFSYFTNEAQNEFWEVNPHTGSPAPSSAICWNAGVQCSGPDATGAYTDCVSTDNGVLHPTERYTAYLDYLVESRGKDVVMLGIFGVPEVTAHNPDPPYEPTAGGVAALEFRVWEDTDLTQADLDDGVEVEDKVWEFGNIAPGCNNENGSAIFPTRVQEVCEGLNQPDDPATPSIDESSARCCIESICDDDFSAAINCLTGAISSAIPPAG
ncbi:MAG: hypothetical protein IPK74_22525 [Deltaproteobacteria bacterium]|nr:hypothetical protein [Deltaproteobacteria bacterium]